MPKINYLFIVNPVSGKRKGLSIVENVRPIFEESNIELTILITQSHNHAFDIASTYDLEKYQAICTAGGDGTAHQVINGMLARKDGVELPIGLIPAGTGNSFLHDLQLTDPIDAANAIIKGNTCHCDLAEIKTENNIIYSFNVISWGVPVDVTTLAEKLRWSRGQRYNLAAIIEIFRNRQRWARIAMDDEVLEGYWGLVVASNTIHAGNGMKMAPTAQIDDGLIDLTIVGKMSRFKLLTTFIKLFSGTHLPDPDIAHHRVRSFQLDSNEKLPLNVDGEKVGYSPFSVKYCHEGFEYFTNNLTYIESIDSLDECPVANSG